MAPPEGMHKTGIRAPLQRTIRRQVAQVLRKLLLGDEKRRSQASIKSLIYDPSVVAKKATLALTCRCLKYLAVLKEIVAATDLLSGKKKVNEELVYVITCDMLFGQEVLPSNTLEDTVLKRRSSLQAALARLLIKKNVASVEDLVAQDQPIPENHIPRYVRVNSLKIGLQEAMEHFNRNGFPVKRDDLIPDLLVLLKGTDLHKDPLILNGSLLLQGKASCMPAQALAPSTGWEVVDACAAPGNKTVQLAALMQGTGKIYAFEKSSKRVQRLQETVTLAEAKNVEVRNEDFLSVNARVPPFSKVQAILLDPSCSGSGTAQQRLDHLMPSFSKGDSSHEPELRRLEQLAHFQERALLHALSFPAVERLVYSTCSVHQRENEDVIKAVLPHATSLGFRLESPFPQWEFRGLPVFDGTHHLLRTDAVRDHMDGFFIALFVRKGAHEQPSRGPEKIISVESVERGTSPSFGDPSQVQAEDKQNVDETCTAKLSDSGRQSKLLRRKLKRQRKKARQNDLDGGAQ